MANFDFVGSPGLTLQCFNAVIWLETFKQIFGSQHHFFLYFFLFKTQIIVFVKIFTIEKTFCQTSLVFTETFKYIQYLSCI